MVMADSYWLKRNYRKHWPFFKNYNKQKGAWPTNAGMMRIYSAMGDYKKTLQYAKAALPQSPDEQTRKFLETAVKTLEEGKPL